MEISSIRGAGLSPQTGAVAGKPAAGFADLLGQAIGQLQQISDNANQKVGAMASGQDVDIADVMLSLQTESLAMNLATTVRNKAVEAYQEVFRMQM
jgi:flagellar hook-basal body complex protein FliE